MSCLVKDNNHYVVHGWMINQLGLRNNELKVYAIIYGFSQTPDTEYNGSLQYLADWCACSKQCIVNCLHSLIEKGCIIKTDMLKNGVKFCSYKANLGYTNNLYGIQKSCIGGIQKSLTNNIDIDIIEKENTKEKHTYGEFKHVSLTDDEYQKLNSDYGSAFTEKIIKFLDEYIEEKAYKSRSHYLAIKRWVVGAVKEKEPKSKEFQKHEYKREVLTEQETPLEMF